MYRVRGWRFSWADESWHTTTDRHGYFFICEQHHASLDHEHTWLSFSCTARHDDCARPIEVRGELLTAPRSAQHIVISDIDDTVVHTGVANKLKMPWKLYFTN